ncbi:hypothetical protein RI129_000410 [Pyrocoelia pectoralis]|uniref:acid phosphatase n=1 Tax=Pyrocoelia pectoralis TaxID=417401 RepID=A0AAN7VS88_9COLE
MKPLIVILVVTFTYGLQHNSSLKLVHVFFRHGSRVPDGYELYRSHERYEYYKQIGFGSLTNAGKLTSYQLGNVLRKRYNDFLGEDFESDAVFIKSTDFERTKMTSLLVLAGVFPPSEKDKWNDKLNWIPIPFTYDKQGTDYDMTKAYVFCPVYQRELQRVFETDEVKAVIKGYNKTFELAIKKTGKMYTTLGDVFLLHQLIHIEQTMNVTLPSWAVEAFPDLRRITLTQFYYENANTLMKRLNGGRMLAKTVENMKHTIQGTIQQKKKIFLYSGHDFTIINMLYSLNLNKFHFPNFNAAICIELHQELTTGMHFVKILYIKDVFDEPELLVIPGCGDMCEFNKFVETITQHLPVNYTEECESTIPLD